MLFLALSCLQGRPMSSAFDELVALDGVDGIQLTPGNMPTPAFEARLPGRRVRTHHGFTPVAFKTRDVWADDGRCRVASDSVHPPRVESAAAAHFLDHLDRVSPILETMYPGWALADGAALRDAMARRLRLAVDVSHVFIQREQGLVDDVTLARLFDYDRVAEIHVSANDGRRDLHAPLTPTSFGLDWARARMAAGVPTILECYFHRLSDRERRGQVELVRTGATRWPATRTRTRISSTTPTATATTTTATTTTTTSTPTENASTSAE